MSMQGLVKLFVLVSGFWFLVSGLMGCTMRHYTVVKDRVDQDLSMGNRGYLYGSVPAQVEPERKTTRKTHTVEIELSSPLKLKKLPEVDETKKSASSAVNQDEVDFSASEESLVADGSASAFQVYTVGKDDTLQKISDKFYGTTKKWNRIYEANRGVLKSPDRVYPGQEIKIPQE